MKNRYTDNSKNLFSFSRCFCKPSKDLHLDNGESLKTSIFRGLHIWILAFFILLISSCVQSLSELKEPEARSHDGKYLVRFSLDSADSMRTVYPKIDLDSDDLVYTLLVSGGTNYAKASLYDVFVSFSFTIDQGKPLEIWLPEGSWDVSVTAYNAFFQPLFFASASLFFSDEEPPPLVVPLMITNFFSGSEINSSSLKVIYHFEGIFDSDKAPSTIHYYLWQQYSSDESYLKADSVSVVENTGILEISNLPSGAYFLNVYFYNNSGALLGSKKDLCYLMLDSQSLANFTINQASLAPLTNGSPPYAPSSLSAVYASEKYELTWDAIADPSVRGYAVYSTQNPAKPLLVTRTVPSAQPVLIGVNFGGQSIYVVAFNEYGESLPSNTVVLTLP